MPRVLFLPAAEFVAFPVEDRCGIVLSGQAVPEILDELKTFGPAQFENRCQFGVHGVKIRVSGSGSRPGWLTALILSGPPDHGEDAVGMPFSSASISASGRGVARDKQRSVPPNGRKEPERASQSEGRAQSFGL